MTTQIPPCPYCGGKGVEPSYPIKVSDREMKCPRCDATLIMSWLDSGKCHGKRITFHPVEPIASEHNQLPNMYHSWEKTEYAINAGVTDIHTTQMALLSTDLFEKGYRIFIRDSSGETEVRLGRNKRTEREIRMAHNLFKLWCGGEFDL